MTVRELYEKLAEYVGLEGNAPVAINVMMENYETEDIGVYFMDGVLHIEID